MTRQLQNGAYLHAVSGEIRDGELYWNDGWYFSRMFEGSVRIRLQWGTNSGTAMVPRAEWDALVAHLSEPVSVGNFAKAWAFERREDGKVRLWHDTFPNYGETLMSAAEWEAIVAHVAVEEPTNG